MVDPFNPGRTFRREPKKVRLLVQETIPSSQQHSQPEYIDDGEEVFEVGHKDFLLIVCRFI